MTIPLRARSSSAYGTALAPYSGGFAPDSPLESPPESPRLLLGLCGLPFGQGHHVRHWAHGGPTTLSNLALLCRRHHRAVHEEGYRVERQPDGALQFRCPNGRPLPDVPPSAAVPADPAQVLRAANVANGLHIHARTACAGWLGEPLNVGWAIDVLHPLAAAPRCLISAHTKAGRPLSVPT